MKRITRRDFLQQVGVSGSLALLPPLQLTESDALLVGWKNPPRDCRPHTRWWWPGNAVSKAGIEQQLTAMKAAGIGGVEIVSSWQWYEKGNLPYLSNQFFEMMAFTAERATLLDLSVSLGFGAGLSFGGFWVPVTERSKCLAPVWLDVTGPRLLDEILPPFKVTQPLLLTGQTLYGNVTWQAPDQSQILAVVAAQVEGSKLNSDSLVVLTHQVINDKLSWEIPKGKWRIGVFRLQYTGQANSAQNLEPLNYCIDHFNPQAMRNYVTYLGGHFTKKLGKYFGKTIHSFFADGFEIAPLPGTLLWSNHLLAEFNRRKGYDLTRYLPALWQEAGPITARVRYDVNEFLHQLSKEIYYGEFSAWCKANRLQARIKAYSPLATELIEAAGLAHQREAAIGATRFETIAEPLKATASGARFYGRGIVSAEAVTSLRAERYRTTLEEMKRTTDAYLRDGVTQIYNHGWTYSEESEVSPERDLPWPNRIQPWAPWFKHYRGLSDYTGRCCWLLRQGQLVADVLIYSSQATAWSETAVYDYTQQRSPSGDLPKLLVANGYDYDFVNDDLLQNPATTTDSGEIKINQHSYRILLLPKTAVIPLASLQRIESFALNGGVVIALDLLPRYAAGIKAATLLHDARITQIVQKLFNGRNSSVHFLPEYKIIESTPSFQNEIRPLITPPQRKLLEILQEVKSPDFSLPDNEQSNGLTFIHKRTGDMDIYFLTNLQPNKITTTVSVRTTGKTVELWDAMSGQIRSLPEYRTTMSRTEIPVTMSPWESIFFVFRPNTSRPYVVRTDLAVIEAVRPNGIIAYATREGEHSAVVARGMSRQTLRAWAPALPEAVSLRGEWKFVAGGMREGKITKTLTNLISWTDSEEFRYFSGEGIYELQFLMPPESLTENVRWILDLGKVAETAEVTLNHKRIGVRWMQPYDFEVTSELKPNENHLRIAVTNTLHNQVAGLRTLAEFPTELKKRYQQASASYQLGTNAWQQYDRKYAPLVSGLLGPIRLIPQGIVLFKL
ncbi:MAG: hypothetical protein HOP19_26280 [Acidobacteria bacterium]|nr:hypothetical protein [Acidobacteriota bacterium]